MNILMNYIFDNQNQITQSGTACANTICPDQTARAVDKGLFLRFSLKLSINEDVLVHFFKLRTPPEFDQGLFLWGVFHQDNIQQ